MFCLRHFQIMSHLLLWSKRLVMLEVSPHAVSKTPRAAPYGASLPHHCIYICLKRSEIFEHVPHALSPSHVLSEMVLLNRTHASSLRYLNTIQMMLHSSHVKRDRASFETTIDALFVCLGKDVHLSSTQNPQFSLHVCGSTDISILIYTNTASRRHLKYTRLNTYALYRAEKLQNIRLSHLCVGISEPMLPRPLKNASSQPLCFVEAPVYVLHNVCRVALENCVSSTQIRLILAILTISKNYGRLFFINQNPASWLPCPWSHRQTYHKISATWHSKASLICSNTTISCYLDNIQKVR
jgi:hypothetical protein